MTDTIEYIRTQLVKKTVAQQQAKLDTYRILKEKKLPIPPDLRREIESQGLE